MPAQFQITESDIGRVAVSDDSWIEDWNDAHKVEPLLWTIQAKAGELYNATATDPSTNRLETAKFDASGYAVEGSIDAPIVLINWQDAAA